MNRTSSPLDEAYGTYSGLDLTLKDQSVLESHVQASSTPRRSNYVVSKTLREQSYYCCSEQFNIFENNSLLTNEPLKRILNCKEYQGKSRQIDQQKGCYYGIEPWNINGSTTSCCHSAQSNNLEYIQVTENHDKPIPLDLRIKSVHDTDSLISDIDSKNLSISAGSQQECEMSCYPCCSEQITLKRNSFNILSLLGLASQFKVNSHMLSENPDTFTNNNNNNNHIKSNFTNREMIDQIKTSYFPFDQLLVDYLKKMNSLVSSSRITQIQMQLAPEPANISGLIQSSSSILSTVASNDSAVVTSPVKFQTMKPNLSISAHSMINDMTNKHLSVSNTTSNLIQNNSQQMAHTQQSSVCSEEDVIQTERGKSCEVGKTPIIFYYPEPFDSKTRVKAMLERNDPFLKYVNDGAAIRNPFAVDRKIQLMHLTSLLCVKLDNNVYLCKGCNRTTKRLRPMQQHLLSHSASKFNLCVKCLKGFNDKYDMKRHTRKHTLVRPYVCPECGRSFSQRCSLEGHRRKIHRIQLNYTPNQRREIVRVCETCGYSCPKLSDMLQHTLNNHPTSNCLPRLQRQIIRYKEKLRNIPFTPNNKDRLTNIQDPLVVNNNYTSTSSPSNNQNFTSSTSFVNTTSNVENTV
ncbi:Transcription factor Ovo-like 2 [Schistosoma japonicum]|nr:Transcription factor Ovo-like 2 [Schistosoma japonicum]